MDRPETQPGRIVGNTTRLVDYYIQKLFKERQVFITDHYNHRAADLHLAKRVQRRMEIEHPRNPVKVNKSGGNVFIKLIENE